MMFGVDRLNLRGGGAPSVGYHGGGGGGRGGGGGGGGKRNLYDKPKPQDKEFDIETWEEMLRSFFRLVNLGRAPSVLTPDGDNMPRASQRQSVDAWLTGMKNAPFPVRAAKFTVLTEAFIHMIVSMQSANRFNSMTTPDMPRGMIDIIIEILAQYEAHQHE